MHTLQEILKILWRLTTYALIGVCVYYIIDIAYQEGLIPVALL